MYLQLHWEYNLSGLQNPKLSNQRVGPFKIVKKVRMLVYKLELPQTMCIHSFILIAHLEPCSNLNADSYK